MILISTFLKKPTKLQSSHIYKLYILFEKDAVFCTHKFVCLLRAIALLGALFAKNQISSILCASLHTLADKYMIIF